MSSKNIYTNPYVGRHDDLFTSWTPPEDFWDDMYDGAELTGVYGGVTPTTWERGNVPWNKGKTGVQPWTKEQKDAQSHRAKEMHKRLGHVEGGKPYEKKGHARIDNTSELNKQILECPHCHKTGNLGNMKRWHFDNCAVKHG